MIPYKIMKHHGILAFVAHCISYGLALAFVAVLIRPELLPSLRPVVRVQASTPRSSPPANPPLSYAQAVETAAPAVVNIYAVRRQPLAADSQTPRTDSTETSRGSGVIVSNKGYVLTNYHVVRDAEALHLTLRDGRYAQAELVGSDPESDLAVLHIPLKQLPSIIIGHSAGLRIGDIVLAIGNPFGVGQTVTLGIVSATGRDRLGLNTFEDFIQTDAAINPGSSGGALVNPLGELVGINTAIFSQTGGSQGIGFAIPADLARNVLTQILEQGRVVRGWLGIEAQNITPHLAESFGLDSTLGVIVAGVQRNGPAEQAGLLPGDVITQVGGQMVADSRGLLNLIARNPPGTRLQVNGVRRGDIFTVNPIIRQRPTPP